MTRQSVSYQLFITNNKKHYNYDNESESSREETEVYEGP